MENNENLGKQIRKVRRWVDLDTGTRPQSHLQFRLWTLWKLIVYKENVPCLALDLKEDFHVWVL